jgi:hypothetical protein
MGGYPLKRSQVLIELIQDNANRVHGLLETCLADCLHWTPDKEANSIAVTIWHTARSCDVHMTQHILKRPFEEEIWYASGWADRVGYKPAGLGTYGWGIVTGYSVKEVRAIPTMNAQLLSGYFDEVIAALSAYLENTPDEILDEPARGFESKQTNYFWVQHTIFDLTRHVGEMLAIQAMWARKYNKR